MIRLALAALLLATTASAQIQVIGPDVDRPISNATGLSVHGVTLDAVDGIPVKSGMLSSLGLTDGFWSFGLVKKLDLPTDVTFGNNSRFITLANGGATDGVYRVGTDGSLIPLWQKIGSMPYSVKYASDGTLYWSTIGTNQGAVGVFRFSQAMMNAGQEPERMAGTGRYSSGQFDANGIPALQANLNGPYGLEVSPLGTVYVSEFLGGAIRAIRDGKAYYVAGTRGRGNSGDGGPLYQAQFGQIGGLLLIGPDLYIADMTNCRIRVAANFVVMREQATVRAFKSNVCAVDLATDDTSLYASTGRGQAVWSYPLGIAKPTPSVSPKPTATSPIPVVPTETPTPIGCGTWRALGYELRCLP